MAERYVINGVEAILVNAEEIEASRLVFGGMTETRTCKYGIEKPHPYYTGSIEFKVQYRGLVLTSTLEYADRSFCKVHMNSMIIDSSSCEKDDVQKLFYCVDVYENRYIDCPDDCTLRIFDLKETQVKVPEFLKRVIVTNMVQLYEKYHDDYGRFHDFETELDNLWSHLAKSYVNKKKHLIDAADAHEQEVRQETRARLKAGECKKAEAHALRNAAKDACYETARTIGIEAEKYALAGCVYYCRENYGVSEEEFREFVKKHYTGFKLTTKIDRSHVWFYI